MRQYELTMWRLEDILNYHSTHIWALQAQHGPAHIWARALFKNSILKNLDIACITEGCLWGIFTKKWNQNMLHLLEDPSGIEHRQNGMGHVSLPGWVPN